MKKTEFPINNDRLNPEQAATFLGITAPTIRKFAHERRITHTKLGTRIYFALKDLETFRTRQIVHASSETRPS